MKDTVIKGNGKSRSIKAPTDMPATFEEWRTQLLAGTATLDIGLNAAGCDVVGTAMNKANLLSDTTKSALELSGSDPTVNDALYALSQKGSPAEVHVMADSGTTVTMSKGGKTLNDTTWDNIAIVSKLGKAQDYWKVGDTKTVAVNGVNYQFQIIGFDHDTLTTKDGTRTKAGITFQMVDCLNTTYSMNGSNTNSGGWNGSTMRTSTMATLLNQLPAALKNVLKSVNKLSGTGGGSTSGTQTTHDKLFLLSEVEIFGTTTYSVPGEGTQYAYYKAGNSKVKKANGSANTWWERSPYSGNTYIFCRVSSNGTASASDASTSRGVSFGFCV